MSQKADTCLQLLLRITRCKIETDFVEKRAKFYKDIS